MNKKNTTRELLIEKIKKQRKELRWCRIRIYINKMKVKFYLKRELRKLKKEILKDLNKYNK